MGDERSVQQVEIDKLSDKIDKLSDALAVTHTEMVRTQTIIREYNGLREKIDSQGKDIMILKMGRSEKEKSHAHLRELGSWAAAGVAILLWLSQVFRW